MAERHKRDNALGGHGIPSLGFVINKEVFPPAPRDKPSVFLQELQTGRINQFADQWCLRAITEGSRDTRNVLVQTPDSSLGYLLYLLYPAENGKIEAITRFDTQLRKFDRKVDKLLTAHSDRIVNEAADSYQTLAIACNAALYTTGELKHYSPPREADRLRRIQEAALLTYLTTANELDRDDIWWIESSHDQTQLVLGMLEDTTTPVRLWGAKKPASPQIQQKLQTYALPLDPESLAQQHERFIKGGNPVYANAAKLWDMLGLADAGENHPLVDTEAQDQQAVSRPSVAFMASLVPDAGDVVTASDSAVEAEQLLASGKKPLTNRAKRAARKSARAPKQEKKQTEDERLRDFAQLPVAEMLEGAWASRPREFVDEVPTKEEIVTAQTLLGLTDEDRAELGVSMIALGTLDEEYHLSPRSETSVYQLYVFFPHKETSAYMKLSRQQLATDVIDDTPVTDAALGFWDDTVSTAAWAWTDDGVVGHENSLQELAVIEQRMVDHPLEAEKLASRKRSLLADVLDKAQGIEAQLEGEFQEIFSYSPEASMLSFYPVYDTSLPLVLLDPDNAAAIPQQLVRSNWPVALPLEISELTQRAANGEHIAQNILARMARTEQYEQEEVPSEQNVSSDIPSTTPLTHAERKRRKRASGAAFHTEGGAEAKASSPRTIGSLSDLKDVVKVIAQEEGFSSQDVFRAHINDLDALELRDPIEAQKKRAEIIRAALTLSAPQREAQGITLSVSGSEDQSDRALTGYTVTFAAVSSQGLRLVSEQRIHILRAEELQDAHLAKLVDDRVATEAQRRPETLGEHYNRLISAITTVDGLIKKKNKEAADYSYRSMGDVQGRKEKEDEIRKEAKALSERKKGLLLDYGKLATTLQPNISDRLFIRQGGSPTQIAVHLYPVREVNKVAVLLDKEDPHLEVVRGAEVLTTVLIKKQNRRTVKSQGSDNATDQQIAAMFAQRHLRTSTEPISRYESDIPLHLQEFAQLSIKHLVIAAIKDSMSSGSGVPSRDLAKVQENVAMQAALNASPEEFENLYPRFIVFGDYGGDANKQAPLEQLFSSYSIYMLNQFAGDTYFFERTGVELASNPYTPSINSQQEQESITAALLRWGAEVRPEDSFLRYKHAATTLFNLELHVNNVGGSFTPGMTDEKKAIINDLYRRKIPLLLNFLIAAKELREQYPDVPPLYSFMQSDKPDIPKMAIRHVVDMHMKRFLLGKTKTRSIRTTTGPLHQVNLHRLREAKKALEEGLEHSYTTLAAKAILAILEPDAKPTSRPQKGSSAAFSVVTKFVEGLSGSLSYAGLSDELTPQEQISLQHSSELLQSLQRGQSDKMTFYTLLEESLQRRGAREAIIAHEQSFTEESRVDRHNRRIFEIKAIDMFIHRLQANQPSGPGEDNVGRDDIHVLDVAKRHLLRLFIQDALTIPGEHRELQRGRPIMALTTRGLDVSITMRKIHDPKKGVTTPLPLDLRVDATAYETTVPREELRQDATQEVAQETGDTAALTNVQLWNVIAPLLPKEISPRWARQKRPARKRAFESVDMERLAADFGVEVPKIIELDDYRAITLYASDRTKAIVVEDVKKNQELETFQSLPLGEKLIRARETHLLARKEQFDIQLARSLKRIALHEALRLSAPQREAQGFTLKVIGHHNEEGKLFVPDDQFSDYKVYLSFPHEGDVLSLRDFRIGLAGNPLERTYPSLSELRKLDRTILEQAQVVEPAMSDLYTTLVSELVNLEGFERILHLNRRADSDTSSRRTFWKAIDQLEIKKHAGALAYFDTVDLLQNEQPHLEGLATVKQKKSGNYQLIIPFVNDTTLYRRIIHGVENDQERGLLSLSDVFFHISLDGKFLRERARLFSSSDAAKLVSRLEE